MNWVRTILFALDVMIVSYVTVFMAINALLLIISSRSVARELGLEAAMPALSRESSLVLPSVSLLVPAYNEEVTIVESIRSLLKLKYPSFEIIICNDGSKDRTVEVLRRALNFVRVEVEYHEHLAAAKVRGFYEVRGDLPPGLTRLLLIDKDNGGKADALNASINAAQGDYVTSMDADSLLVPDALLLAARPIALDREGIVAVGAQVGISNGSIVEGGRVVEMRIPKPWISRFQIVEYMRSFAQGRVAFAKLRSLVVLSGVFALMRRDRVLEIGGFLTKGMKTRIGLEYCGVGAHTVCEDMEIVVRLHRYLHDKKLPGRVEILAFPIAWTEAPENYQDIGKQRARWYRGLLEVMVYHRAMLFRPKFGAIGMFSLPYQLLFEALAPIVECFGYLTLIVNIALGTLSPIAASLFFLLALTAHFALSTLSILLCVRSEQKADADTHVLSLFNYARMRDVVLLVWSGFVSNLGYRQYLVGWQLKGLYDFLKGKKTWDKFARKGFAPATKA
jgi:cellulose synthase/poly-beta-1,6-N-acetylglucosamine synthase-like glycosyltransferase